MPPLTSTTGDDLRREEPVRRYNRTAMTLHWLVAALLLVNVVYGLEATASQGPSVGPLINMHKSIGLTLLGLILLRILWRLGHKPPQMPHAYPAYERKGAHLAHFLLYAVMLLLPVTGYIHDSAWKLAASHPTDFFGLFDFPRLGFIQAMEFGPREWVHSAFGAAHVWLGYALYALFALHIAGVLKHHLIDHESELSRMLPAAHRRSDDA